MAVISQWNQTAHACTEPLKKWEEPLKKKVKQTPSSELFVMQPCPLKDSIKPNPVTACVIAASWYLNTGLNKGQPATYSTASSPLRIVHRRAEYK